MRCGGRTRAPGEGRLLPGCGASRVGRSPTPDCPPSGRAAGAHYPLAVGAAGCARGDSSQIPQLALLRAGFARCGGGMRVPGGAPLAWVWGSRGRALSHPRLPALWAGCRGPLPTGCGYGGVRAWGPVTNPTARALASWLCALRGQHEGAQGGRLLPGCGASGVGRSPTPDCPPSGRVAGAHYPLAVVAGGCGRGDPSPTPHRALFRARFARCGGGTMAPRGGAPPAWVWGVRGRALSHPRLPSLWAGCRGPLPTGCGCGVVRALGTVTYPTARALASWLCALWRRHEGAQGGRLLPGCGVSGVGRSPTPDCPPSGRAAGAHYPLAVGAGRCGCGDPSPTPQRALLRAGFVRCGGGMRVPGGTPPVWVWGVRGQALSHPRLPALWAGCRGRLPTGCGCRGVRALGPVTNPTARALASWLCALWGRHEGARGKAPPAWVWGVRGRALSHPRLPALWAGSLGPLPPACGSGGVRAWGPVTNATAGAVASWLCALWGRHEGAQGRAPPAWVWGVRGRALSQPRVPALWAGCRGPLPTGCGCGGLRAWGPVTNPTARALASLLCALWGRHEGARGGASCLGVGRPGSGALPPPTARPLGGLSGPTTHWLWVRRGAGVGTSHQPHSARSGELALCAVGVAWRRPGGHLLSGCGASGVGRSPTPDCPPSGRAAGADYPLAVGAGGCGRGDPSPTPQRALLRAGFARCGGGMRVPGGGRLRPGCGASGVGRSPTPDCLPSGRAAGAHYPLPVGAGGCGRGEPSPTPQRALLRAGSARCGGGTRAPWGGGASCLGVGRPVSGALPPRLPALLVGCRGRLPTGCGCGGVPAWGPVTNPTARALASWLCALWGRHEGALGGASCLGVGRPGSGALPPPTARPPGGLPGPTTHWLWVRGGAGVGTRHKPHSARSCKLALRAVGGA